MNSSWKIDFKSSLTNVDTINISNTIDFYLWVIQIISILLCTALLIAGSSKLANNHYKSGFITIIGAVLTGISPFLANVFLF